MTMLLFSAEFNYLGEFLFEQGSLTRSTWTRAGMNFYASLADRWQLTGIQIATSREWATDEGLTRSVGYQSTLLKSPEAEFAFRNWALDAGNMLLDMPDRLLPDWETLCRLDLIAEERFALAREMRHASYQVLELWRATLQEEILRRF